MSSGDPEGPSDDLETAAEGVGYYTGVAENDWAVLESSPRSKGCGSRRVESGVDGTREEEVKHEAVVGQGHCRCPNRCSSQSERHCEESK